MQTTIITPSPFEGSHVLKVEASTEDMRLMLGEYQSSRVGPRRYALNLQIHQVLERAEGCPGFNVISDTAEFDRDEPASPPAPKRGAGGSPAAAQENTTYPPLSPEQIVAALQRMAVNFNCDLKEVTDQFNRLSPEYPGDPALLLRATSISVMDHGRRSREEADAAAYLLRCRTKPGQPLGDAQIRLIIRMAKDAARIAGIPLADAVRHAVNLRGYLPPETLEEALARLSDAHGVPLADLQDAAGRWSRFRFTANGRQRRLTRDEILAAVLSAFQAASVAGASLDHVESSMQSIFSRLSHDISPAPVSNDGPLRSTGLTNHGHQLSPESPVNHAAPAETCDHPDLTAEELDAQLVQFSEDSFPPVSINEIREFARSVRESIPQCSNRYILEYATHVYTDTPASTEPTSFTFTAAPACPAPIPALPATVKIEIELSEEEAACWWADVTWNGKAPRSFDSIARDHVLQHLHKVMRQTIRPGREQAVEDFRKFNPR